MSLALRFPNRAAAIPVAALLLASAAFAQQRPPSPTPPDLRMRWYAQHEAMVESSRFRSPAWQFLGPTNIGGRATDVAVVGPKGLSYTVYVAEASGGVWKTENEGTTWTPVFQHGPSTSIGDVTVATSDPDIVWIGTGEANIFRSSMAGAGVFKSTDGGQTWEHKGLVGTHTIPRILIHPSNPAIVYVASSGHEWTPNEERGVYVTRDGGDTWEKILYIDEHTGAIDLVMHPDDPNTLYAATWQRVRKKWNDPRNEAGYTGSGIWKTTDGGATWSQMNTGLPDARYRGRIGIDIARSNPNTLYAFVDNYEVARMPDDEATDAYGRPAGPIIKGASVWRSDDAGASWRRVSAEDAYMERASGTYGWVFGQLRVDPNDPETVYFMGLGLNVSNDGGKTWRRLTGMHGDHHALWIDPANLDYLFNGNDGGVYVSYDGGENWRSFTSDVPAVQFFNLALDMGDPFRAYGSIQDHGSYRGVVDLSRGRNDIRPAEWENAPGGEGSNHAIDPRDPTTVYSAGFYGRISRSDLDEGESISIVPEAAADEPRLRGQWLAPFMLSPHDPNVLYHGMQYLYRSMDRGDTWTRLTPDLSRNDTTRYGDIPFQTVFSIAESPLKFGVIYAGTDDGRLHVTRDAGATWTEIGGSLPQDRFVAEIVASKRAEGTVYVALNGKRDDDFAPYLYRSTDYGRTWTALTGIPIGPINVIEEDPKNPDVLYVGTDIGVYVSLDAGRTWDVLGDLPSTFVADLVVHPRDDILVAATHGRGMWAADVRPIQKLSQELRQAPVAIVPPDPAMLPRGGGGFGGFQVAPAYVFYHLREAGPVTLTVKDAAGGTVRTLEASGHAGLNMAEWNLSGAPRPGGAQGGFGGRANLVDPGLYTVELKQGDRTASAVLPVSR